MGIVFPTVARFGWCACTFPYRTKTCRNELMNVYVLGQYLGEVVLERTSVRDRLRNRGYRLVTKTRPKCPAYLVDVAVNAEFMGCMMRFVNRSCNLVAEFREFSNGRRTIVVVATATFIRKGREITVDYGDNLWFVCRCGDKRCCHRDVKNEEDP
ncbi:hypothetical protein PR001_g26245 [Phytophthora rubi]|uniref:SET domain-containing protein n=1 Tax=Phytophthora rubi TaxID=129364 RepID=A0A6A3HVE3_9STRA|nr:hypothetical protein PR001_g26245 [Phytophthora rubi]